MESCSRIKDENERLGLGKDEVRRKCRDYFDDLYNILNRRLQSKCVAAMVFREVTP